MKNMNISNYTMISLISFGLLFMSWFSQANISEQELINETNTIIAKYTESGWFSGNITITKDSSTIYNKSIGFADIDAKTKMTSDTKIRIGSINKHYTAVLIMQLVQAGQINLNDTLAKFELGFPNHIASKITVNQLLKHTSGFADIFTDEYFKTYQKLKDINAKLPLLMDAPLISEPGVKYNYSNYGYIVLGAIIEKLSGKTFKQVLTENILNKIGADNTVYDLTENVKGKARSYHFSKQGEKVDRTHILENVTPDGGMYATSADITLFYNKLFYSNELLDDKHKAILGSGYNKPKRTWPEILASSTAHWSSYGGGPGVSAAAEILIKDRLIVVVLANTDGLVAERISQKIIDVFQNKAE